MHSPMCNNGLEFVALLLNNGEEEIVLDGKMCVHHQYHTSIL